MLSVITRCYFLISFIIACATYTKSRMTIYKSILTKAQYPRHQRQQSPATIFSHTLAQRPHTQVQFIYIPKIIAHGAPCGAAQEREHLTQMLHFFVCIVESVSIYRLAIPILFSTSSHMPKTPFILRHCYEFRVWNAIRCRADCSTCWMYIIFIHLQPFLFHALCHRADLRFFFTSSHTWASCVKPSRFNP